MLKGDPSFSIGVNFNDAARARTAYAALKQGASEGLSSFKERMEVLIKALKPLVLLDNQAQRSIFCNEKLLEDFTKNETPYIYTKVSGVETRSSASIVAIHGP